jgi:hypothetical protein
MPRGSSQSEMMSQLGDKVLSFNGFTYCFEVELFEDGVKELGHLPISRHRLAASNS